MNTNILASAAALSDRDLLTRLDTLAGREREASVELVAHLAALDTRPAVYAAQGYGSLFRYCTQALRLSEDAACNRIEAARACRRFPVIVELLASGGLTLTSVRLLARHLTAENHQAVLWRAKGRSRHEIDVLVAELAPRPDIPTSVRKVPTRSSASALSPAAEVGPPSATSAVVSSGMPTAAATGVATLTATALGPSPGTIAPAPRPVVRASAPQRYRVQFTIGQATHERLRRVQAFLRREIPDGDPAVIFDRALALLLETVERTKLGAEARPRRSIRPRTDERSHTESKGRTDDHMRRHDQAQAPKRSRLVPRKVKHAVWQRDGGRCAFVVPSSGMRCAERTFLEFHHVQPYAKRGPATVANISLRCRRHNQYEAELIFGPRHASIARADQ